MKTFVPKDVEKKWWLVDAEGQTLGRLASRRRDMESLLRLEFFRKDDPLYDSMEIA